MELGVPGPISLGVAGSEGGGGTGVTCQLGQIVRSWDSLRLIRVGPLPVIVTVLISVEL